MSKKQMNGQIRRSYLRDRYKFIVVYGLIVAFFFGVAALYGYWQILRNMLYVMELILFLGMIFILADYLQYRSKCLALLAAIQKEDERICDLPKAGSMPEKLYQQLLAQEEKERRRLLTGYDEKQKDMADYYTMWTHQIKTPIAAMRLLLQDPEGAQCRTKGKEEDADRRKELEELFKIEQYTEMALYYAKLDSLVSDYLFQNYDVGEIVKKALRKYGVLFMHSGLSFKMEEFEIRTVTDEKWLCFVVEQVLSNALKYTYEGGISIYGGDKNGEPSQGQIFHLVIEDTGIGISDSDLPRIFERGFTGYNGRLDQKATGLGLYLCDQIMRRLSHTMQVKSEPGKGTKVILGFVQEQ